MSKRLVEVLRPFGVSFVDGDYQFRVPHAFDAIDYCGFCNVISGIDVEHRRKLDPGQVIIDAYSRWGPDFVYQDYKVASDFFGNDLKKAFVSMKELREVDASHVSGADFYLTLKTIRRAEESFHRVQKFIGNPYDENNLEALERIRLTRQLTYLRFEFPENAGFLIKSAAELSEYRELMRMAIEDENYEMAAEARDEIEKLELGINTVTSLDSESFVRGLIDKIMG